MSPAHRRRQTREPRHQCAACRTRRALFRYRGHVCADRDHTLCFECFRSQVDRMRAIRLARAAA
jgi:hypothetical protein